MTTYWISDVCSLFNSFNINPFTGDDKNYKFNSLTRLIIVVTLLSALLFNNNSKDILIAGSFSLVLSVIIYLLTYNSKLEKLEKSDEETYLLPGYKNAEISLEDQQKIKAITPAGKNIKEDIDQNIKNLVSLDYVPRNTEEMKTSFFLNPVDTNNINNITESDNKRKGKYISYAPHTQTGTLKCFDSMIGKNFSMTSSGGAFGAGMAAGSSSF
jgi:hypothetical protein